MTQSLYFLEREGARKNGILVAFLRRMRQDFYKCSGEMKQRAIFSLIVSFHKNVTTICMILLHVQAQICNIFLQNRVTKH